MSLTTDQIFALDDYELSEYLHQIKSTTERKRLAERIRYQKNNKHIHILSQRFRHSLEIDTFTYSIKEKPYPKTPAELMERHRMQERQRYQRNHN